jgi:hypothetical protein
MYGLRQNFKSSIEMEYHQMSIFCFTLFEIKETRFDFLSSENVTFQESKTKSNIPIDKKSYWTLQVIYIFPMKVQNSPKFAKV